MEYLLDINNIDEQTLHKLKLHSPTPVQGGSYLAKMTLNGNRILFQMPKCSTKKGVITSGKRYYCDLLFKYDNSHVIDFIENIEMIIRDKILDRNELWFQDPPSLEDIEYNWNDSIKQTKQNFYLRTYVGNVKNLEKSVSVYDSNQEKITIDSILPSSNIITIIEITGLKFSSSSFHINYCLRQIMVLEEKPIFNKCLINFSKNPSPVKKMLATEQEQSENTTDDKNETRPLQPDGLEKADDTLDISKKNNIELTIVDDPVEENTPTDTNENITTSPELINDLGEKVNTDNKEEAIEHVSDSLETLNTSSINNLAENDTFENENIPNNEELLKSTGHQSLDLEESSDASKESDNLEIKEVELDIPEEDDMFQLKKPDTVYLDIYKQALEKARDAKIKAIQAYLELREIKNKYMIQEVDEDDENFSELNFDF
tara:strand:- start:187 stop:1479 length:1293 start_codon:yes stop_codon:yes gene_type:complete